MPRARPRPQIAISSSSTAWESKRVPSTHERWASSGSITTYECPIKLRRSLLRDPSSQSLTSSSGKQTDLQLLSVESSRTIMDKLLSGKANKFTNMSSLTKRRRSQRNLSRRRRLLSCERSIPKRQSWARSTSTSRCSTLSK